MKNKRYLKYLFTPLLNVIISLLATIFFITTIKSIITFFYRYTKVEIFNILVDAWFRINLRGFNDIVTLILGIAVFLTIYVLIASKKAKAFSNIIEEVDAMAGGDLDKKIEVEANGELGRLAENINSIATQLKEITVTERRAQKTKADLITNVSHDLRTPLTSIIGYLEIINNDRYKDEVVLRHYTNIVYTKAKNMNFLINDLFELTKMQNNTIEIKKQRINITELVGQVVAFFEYQFRVNRMEARTIFSNDILMVNADGEKLVRAFENLLSNSIKYGKDGHYVDVVIEKADGNVIIEFINYGEKIPEYDIPYIFNRFYRVEKSRNSEVAGSGLGLAITKSIIEMHNGAIEVKSSYEKTAFNITLPMDL